MVVLLPGNLRAAMGEGAWTAATLARKLGAKENRQTVHHLMQGEQPTKCRKRRRSALAKALDVPEEWLAGETLPMPFTAWVYTLAAYPQSARVSLALARLLKRCATAGERDVARYRAEPDTGSPLTASQAVLEYLTATIGSMASPLVWRRALFAEHEQLPGGRKSAKSVRPPSVLKPTTARMSPVDEGATLALIRGIAHVLEPWFTDALAMRYGQLEGFALAMNPDSRVTRPGSDRPDRIVTTEGRVLSVDSPQVPYCVLHWPDHTSHECERPEAR